VLSRNRRFSGLARLEQEEGQEQEEEDQEEEACRCRSSSTGANSGCHCETVSARILAGGRAHGVIT